MAFRVVLESVRFPICGAHVRSTRIQVAQDDDVTGSKPEKHLIDCLGLSLHLDG